MITVLCITVLILFGIAFLLEFFDGDFEFTSREITTDSII